MTDERAKGGERPQNKASEKAGTQSEAVQRYLRAAEERRKGAPQWMDPAPPRSSDTLWRALTREGEVRLLVARLGATSDEIARLQGCSADTAQLLAESIVATQLIRSTLNPEAQMQLHIQHSGPMGRVVVDAFAEGGMRAALAEPAAVAGEEGLLGLGAASMVRHSRMTGTYRSTIQLEGDGIEGLMMRYLLESEQMVCLLRLEVRMEGERVAEAGGFLLQITPEGRREDLQQLVANLDGLDSLLGGMTDEDPDGRAWASELMHGMLWDQCGRQEVGVECRCSESRVLTMLSTLSRADLEEIVQEGTPVQTVCEYCKTTFAVAPARLSALLSPPS